MTKFAPNKEQSGFTLIEVLIAITVFAIGILAVITMQTSGVTGNAKAQQISNATNLASNQMEILLNADYDSVVTTLPVQSGNYQISWVVVPNSPMPNAKAIQITAVSRFNSQLTKKVTSVTINFVKVKGI